MVGTLWTHCHKFLGEFFFIIGQKKKSYTYLSLSDFVTTFFSVMYYVFYLF